MANLEQSCMVLDLALALKANGSWAGETHIQKAGYFLNKLLKVPTNLEFILYKHGPFSFDLRELLTDMEANGFIRWIPQPPYGPSIDQGALGPNLKAKFSRLASQYAKQISFIALQLGNHNVSSLERIATALYVDAEGYRGAARVGRIVELKPHVESFSAEKAVEEFDRIRNLASQQNIILH